MQKNQVGFFSLGGIDEKGKNSYILEIDDNIFVLDMGVKKPIISRLGVDTIIPSFDYIVNNSKQVKGVFISHVHDEHFASLPWLLKEVKGLDIYASKFSIEVIKKRLAKYNINHKNYRLIEVPRSFEINGIKIRSFPLAHSVPGTTGFTFNTRNGAIVYTTDYILNHPFKEFGETNVEAIQKSVENNTLLWINDCSRGHISGFASEKAKITNLIWPFFEKTPKNSRIIVGAFDEEMVNIHEVLILAKKMNRPVVLYGREYFELLSLFKEENPDFVFPKIIPYQRANKHDNAIVIISGKGERLYQRFFRIIENNDVYLKIIPTDRVLTIMPPINGHEKLYTRVLDDVMRITPHVLAISSSQFNKFQPQFNDIETIFKALKPKYFVPVRGLHRYLSSTINRLADQNLIQVGYCYLLKNGKKVIFEGGKYVSQNTKVKNVEDVIIDGFGIGDISDMVIFEREKLSGQGVYVVSIVFDLKKPQQKVQVDIQSRGVFVVEEEKEVYKETEKIVHEEMKFLTDNKPQKFNRRNVQNNVRKRVQKVIRQKIGKEPIVIPILYDL